MFAHRKWRHTDRKWSERSRSQHQEKTLLLRGAATEGFYLHSQNTGVALHQCSGRFTLAPDRPQAPPPQSLVSWSHHMTRNNSSHQWVIVSDFFFSPSPPKKLIIIPFLSFFVATFPFYLFIIILTSRRASKLSLLVECFGWSGVQDHLYGFGKLDPLALGGVFVEVVRWTYSGWRKRCDFSRLLALWECFKAANCERRRLKSEASVCAWQKINKAGQSVIRVPGGRAVSVYSQSVSSIDLQILNMSDCYSGNLSFHWI